jgi:hypothetical protein
MDRVVIEDCYYMTIMDENVNWMKLAHLMSKNNNLRAPFCKLTFASRFSITFLNAHTKEIYYLSLMCTKNTMTSNNIPYNTHVNSYIV